jgi:hypothetical protein
MMTVRVRTLLLPIALILSAAATHAQNVTVTATVPLASPAGTGTRDLRFGDVVPTAGLTQNIDVVAAPAPASGTLQSGEFTFDVSTARGVAFRITVPTQLTQPDAAPIPLSANGTQYGSFCVVAGAAACTLTNFNPAAASDVLACAQLLGSGNCHPNRVYATGSAMRVYVGGNLAVTQDARPGVYTGTVTMTIVQVY